MSRPSSLLGPHDYTGVFFSFVGGAFFEFEYLYSWNVQSTGKKARKGVLFSEFYKKQAHGARSRDKGGSV